MGQAFDLMLSPQRSVPALLRIALLSTGVRLIQGLIGLAASGTFEVLAQRFARDARVQRHRLGQAISTCSCKG